MITTHATIDTLQIENMHLTISFTMTVDEWRKLMRQQPTTEHPGRNLSSRIAAVLGHITRMSETTVVMPEQKDGNE